MSSIVNASSSSSSSDDLLAQIKISDTNISKQHPLGTLDYGEYESDSICIEDTFKPYEIYSSENALEPQSSMESHLSEGRSSSTQSPIYLSEVVSEYEEKMDEDFVAPRMKQFFEAIRPGLIWSGGKSHLLEAAQNADKLLAILDNGFRRLLEARREFCRPDITRSSRLKLIDGWIWILLQAISELKWPNDRNKLLKEHLYAKMAGLSSDLTHTCRLLMIMSINTRIGDNLLSEVIRKQNGRFRTPNLKSTMYLKIKPSGIRFRCAPKLRPINPSATESDCTLKWTPKDGLILLNLGKIEVIKFCDLDNNQKLSLINVFIDEIRTKIIQSAYMILEQATNILPVFRSTSSRFGEKPSLRMKPTSNGMEKHILNINALLENGKINLDKATFCDDTMGYVLLEYLFEIRLRMFQVIQLSEDSSSEYQKIHSILKKLEKKLDAVMLGDFNDFQQPTETLFISIGVSTEGIPDKIFHTFVQKNEEKHYVEFVSEDSLGSESEVSSIQTRDVKIDISESSVLNQQPRMTRIRRFMQWLMRNKTNGTVTV